MPEIGCDIFGGREVTSNRYALRPSIEFVERCDLEIVASTDRPISIIDMGDDMAAIVKQLGYRQVDALGYSLGGGV